MENASEMQTINIHKFDNIKFETTKDNIKTNNDIKINNDFEKTKGKKTMLSYSSFHVHLY